MAEETVGELGVKIRPNTTGFQSELTGSLKGAATAIAGVFAGYQVVNFLRGGLAELGEQQKVAAQTAAVIRSTGAAAQVTADQVSDLAGELQELSGKDAEAIQAGENLLLTFKTIRNEAGAGNDVFDQATKAALDLSVAFGQDMTQSAILVGKALDSPVAGLTALQRVGVRFTEQQKEQIKTLEESGRHMEAQKVILAELESQVGGSAEAYGQTLPGKLERARNALDDLKGSIVAGAGPALETLAQKGVSAASAFSGLPPWLQTTTVAAAGLVAVAGPLSRGIEGVKKGVDGAKKGVTGLAGSMKTLEGALRTGAFAGAAGAAYLLTRRLEENRSAADRWAHDLAGGGTLPERIGRLRDELKKATAESEKYASVDVGPFHQYLSNEGREAADRVEGLRRELELLEGQEKDAKNAADLAARGVDELGNKTSGAADDTDKLTDSMKEAVSAATALEDAVTGVADANDRVVDAQRAAQKAQAGIIDAQRSARNAHEAVTDAELALSKARQEGDPEQILRAERSLRDAREAEQKAIEGVSDAQYDAERAQRAVERAQVDAARAVVDLNQKQTALTDATYGSNVQVGQLVDYLRGIEAQSPATAAALDPIIAKLVFLQQLQAATPPTGPIPSGKNEDGSDATDIGPWQRLKDGERAPAPAPPAAQDWHYEWRYGQLVQVPGPGPYGHNIPPAPQFPGFGFGAAGGAGAGPVVVQHFNGMTATGKDDLAAHAARQTAKTLTLLGGS